MSERVKPKKREQEAWAVCFDGSVIFVPEPRYRTNRKDCIDSFCTTRTYKTAWQVFKNHGYTCQKITMRVK